MEGKLGFYQNTLGACGLSKGRVVNVPGNVYENNPYGNSVYRKSHLLRIAG